MLIENNLYKFEKIILRENNFYNLKKINKIII